MNQRSFSTLNSAATITILWLVMWLPASGQAPQAQRASSTAQASATAAKTTTAPWAPSRTPDGQPDIQGIYARSGVGGLDQNAREANSPENPLDVRASNPLSVGDRPDGLGNTPKGLNVGGTRYAGPPPQERKRSGIVDPPDQKLPWKPEEDAKRREFLLHTNPAEALRYVEFESRCALPGLFKDNGPFQFVQPSGAVVILSEYNHVTRVIQLDGRPHPGKDIHLFMGDSVGHWEGNTLVVDTTNFNGSTAFTRSIPYLSDELHTIERLTIIDQNNMQYEVTIDDPKLFTKPWKTAGLFRRVSKDFEMIEYACAEGLLALENIFGDPPER